MTVPNKIKIKTAQKPKGLKRLLAKGMKKRSAETLEVRVKTLNALGAMTNIGQRQRSSPDRLDYIYVIDGTAWASNGHFLMAAKLSDEGHTGVIHGSLAKQVKGQGTAEVIFRTGKDELSTELRTDAGEFITENDMDHANAPDFMSIMPSVKRQENRTRIDAKYVKAIADAALKSGASYVEFGFASSKQDKGKTPVRITGWSKDGYNKQKQEDTEWLLMPLST